MNGFSEVAGVTIAGGLAFGMILSLMGGSRRALTQWLQLAPAQAQGLLSALTIALIPFTILAGALADAIGAVSVVCVGSILASLALLLLVSSGAQSYARCVGAALLAGGGAAFLNCGSTVLMPRAFFDGNPVAATNLGFVFVGLGALITPVVADLLLRLQGSGYRLTLGLFGLLALVPIGFAVMTPWSSWGSGSGTVNPQVFLRPSVWLAGAVFLLYAPLEGWLSASALPFLQRSGFRDRGAAILLAVTWLVFLGSRFAIAYWQQSGVLDPGSGHLLMLLLALIATIGLGNLSGAEREDSIVVWMLLIAACLGPIFPSLTGFMFLPPTQPQEYGTAYGMMFAVGTTGSLLLAPLYSPGPGKATPDKTVLRVLTGFSLSLIAVILATWVTR